MLSAMCGEMRETAGGPSIADMSLTSARPSSGQERLTDHHPSSTYPGDYDYLGVTLSEAEILLDRFRRLMAHGLPFVVLPPETTARHLYQHKPFLLHAIVTVTYFHSLAKQQSMVKQLMRDLSERVLMNNEKNIGILQGILVSLALAVTVAFEYH